MARYDLARTTPVRLCDLAGSSAVLSREQWAVACAIDGALSVQDLAWHCGLALYDTIECVGSSNASASSRITDGIVSQGLAKPTA